MFENKQRKNDYFFNENKNISQQSTLDMASEERKIAPKMNNFMRRENSLRKKAPSALKSQRKSQIKH